MVNHNTTNEDDFLDESNEEANNDNTQVLMPALSHVYQVKIGGFGETNDIVTYQSCVTVEVLKKDFQLFETLSSDNAWPISDRFQREVDISRVKKISQYIKSRGSHLKYFPPILIALLPRDMDARVSKEFKYSTDSSIDPAIRLKIFNVLNNPSEKFKDFVLKADNLSILEGLYILKLFKAYDNTVLCWDLSKYYAVIIDGQHRYEALISSAQADKAINNYLQDILFIDLSRSLKNDSSKTLIQAVRKVFSDINTTAESLSKVGGYLLTDKSLASVFVQELVNDDHTDSSLYIIPQIIDWHGVKFKHELPHVTSILVLYQLMSDLFISSNLSSMDDFMTLDKIKPWCQFLNRYLDIDTYIKNDNATDLEKIADLYNRYAKLNSDADTEEVENDNNKKSKPDSTLFEFDYRILNIARESFRDKFLRAFVLFFHKLKPYEEIIEFLKTKDAFNKSSIYSKALIASEIKLKDKVKESEDITYETILKQLKKEADKIYLNKYYLLYTVLGQKALFNIYLENILENAKPNSNEEFYVSETNSFLKEINSLFDILDYGTTPLFGFRENVQISDTSFLSDYLRENEDGLGNMVIDFWDSIIYYNESIIYTSTGISSLTSILRYTLKKIKYLKNKNDGKIDFKIPFMKSRIKRRIRIQFRDWESMVVKINEDILESKRKFLDYHLETAYAKWLEENTVKAEEVKPIIDEVSP